MNELMYLKIGIQANWNVSHLCVRHLTHVNPV